MRSVEAVIRDFGGVFTSSPFEAFARRAPARTSARSMQRVNTSNSNGNAWALFERAEIDAARFDTRLLADSTALGHSVPDRDVLPLLAGDVRPRMVTALKSCRARFKVGCITNNMATPELTGPQAVAA